MISHADIEQAARRTAGLIRRTPVLQADPGVFKGEVWFKCEFMQHTGTFKARGAINRILASKERGELRADVGIVVASGGNAGLANAYAAKQLGVPATVFVPEAAPAVKVAKLRAIGASVVQGGAEYAAAYQAAVAHAEETGAVYCHAYDQPEIAAGAGTVGSELLEQLPDIDTVLVAAGGGGLMAGVAAAVEGSAKVVAVEPESAPTLHAALAAGQPVDVAVSGIAADSLGARRVGDIGFSVAVRCGVVSVLVTDEQIVAARSALWNDYRIVVEHGAAAAFAALASGAYVPAEDERVAVILCGANTDPATL
ncbi:threonine/serine dehydratase [Arthrobacter sp. FW306-05-C]|uniref:threonine/serine dehydratase n=1 Tax=unclassified Arthrobacter TaxID=235627 RepID=UPI001EEF87FB|nr:MULTISPECIES: threonine/serine dehydratase [unclassified Arthrobacter]UKA66350.1 threonine/serine dehydratase [Arthrobacter sp. FW306-05-C]UKA70683.1 threonine/serine dehydratase [Arthrobacter sp. FW306-06-A]UKA75004.1 threonine/serine dehydratase [Arthrobacter sp. FW306-07-I]